MSDVHLIVPAGIDDATRASGGNTYDRRVRDGLRAAGWTVDVHEIDGDLATLVASIPDDALALVDGLVASPAPEVLVPAARRVCLVVLLHMPLGDEREARVLSAARAIVTTSHWTRRALVERHPLLAGRVHVAAPGVEAAPLAAQSTNAGQMLSVAAVIPGKGHDVLVDALALLAVPGWNCLCVGSLDRDRTFAADVRRRADHRVRFAGAQSETEVARAYANADVLVLPTRFETYGMVLTEALARGVPVVAADVGGVREAVGTDADGGRPGILVRPNDPVALAAALRAWLEDASLRRRLRRAARALRTSLAPWTATTSAVARVLEEAAR